MNKGMLTMRKLSILFLSIMAVVLAAAQAQEDYSLIIRLNPAIDDILPADAKVEKLAGTDVFGFLDGAVWVRRGGYLLFSDVFSNVIYKWSPDQGSPGKGKVSVFLPYSGWTGTDDTNVGIKQTNGKFQFILIGSDTVTLDPQGRVTYNAMGDHAIVRLEEDGKRTVLASQYEGKRLNGPNDLVYKSNGSLYFTDPPSSLRQGAKDPKKELPFSGVFLLKGGNLQVIIKDLSPNGITLSPDEKYLYVTDSKRIMQYDVQPDDTVANGRAFIDMSSDDIPGGFDGMKVDQKGNLYARGPGAVWIISPEGKHLGSILMAGPAGRPENAYIPSNMAFGDADGKTLYLTPHNALYKIRLKIPGIIPGPK